MPIAFRFAVMGAVNTLIGLTFIVLFLVLGFNDYVANALGYGLGLGVSYRLNRRWTFKATTPPSIQEFGWFVASFLLAYTGNLAVLAIGRSAGFSGQPALHFAGLAAYSVAFFALSRTLVFSERRKISNGPRVTIVCIGLALLIFGIVSAQRLTHDVVWQFWIARQMIGGAKLYVDIIEINPPLWFWMAVGVTYIAGPLGISAQLLIKVILVALAVLSVLLTDSLSNDKRLRNRIILAVSTLVVITLVPIYDFGQREHLVLITALPYCALISARSRHEPADFARAMAIGLLAAIGFALKHYFIVIPILLEAYLLSALRREYRVFRPETLTLAICAICYGAAVMYLSPEFITHILPLVNLAYDGYENGLLTQLVGWHQYIIYAAIVAIIIHRRLFNFRTDNVVCYLVASFGFGVAYFAQKKGWQYHALPVIGLLLISLIALMLNAWERAVSARSMVMAWFALLSTIFISSICIGPYRSGEEEAFNFAMEDLSPGDTVFAVSTGPRFAWPMMEEYHLVWPSRYFAMWTTVATEIPTGSAERRAKLKKLAYDIRANTLHDLSCNPPTVIMVEHPLRSAKLNSVGFSYIEYLREYPGFSEFLANYRHVGWEAGIDKYVLYNRGYRPSTALSCRTIV